MPRSFAAGWKNAPVVNRTAQDLADGNADFLVMQYRTHQWIARCCGVN